MNYPKFSAIVFLLYLGSANGLAQNRSSIPLESRLVSPDASFSAATGPSITGFVFFDRNRDGRYQAGKDKIVSGALITLNGRTVVSAANGSYRIEDVPAANIHLQVTVPDSKIATMIIFNTYGVSASVDIPIYP